MKKRIFLCILISSLFWVSGCGDTPAAIKNFNTSTCVVQGFGAHGEYGIKAFDYATETCNILYRFNSNSLVCPKVFNNRFLYAAKDSGEKDMLYFIAPGKQPKLLSDFSIFYELIDVCGDTFLFTDAKTGDAVLYLLNNDTLTKKLVIPGAGSNSAVVAGKICSFDQNIYLVYNIKNQTVLTVYNNKGENIYQTVLAESNSVPCSIKEANGRLFFLFTADSFQNKTTNQSLIYELFTDKPPALFLSCENALPHDMIYTNNRYVVLTGFNECFAEIYEGDSLIKSVNLSEPADSECSIAGYYGCKVILSFETDRFIVLDINSFSFTLYEQENI